MTTQQTLRLKPPSHAARISSSPRLRRTLDFLRSRGKRGATTFEIIQHAQVCAVNSIIHELRENELTIPCTFERIADDGARIYRYTLIEEAA